MAWRRAGHKSLSEPMKVNIYWCIYASRSLNELKSLLANSFSNMAPDWLAVLLLAN